MRLWLLRRGAVFHPYDDASMEQMDTIPWEKPLKADITRKRNIDFDRLFHAMCHKIGQGIGRHHDFVVDALKVKTGHYVEYELPGNRIGIKLKSIAWDKMDGLAFKEFFERCVVVIYEEWGVDPKVIAEFLVRPGTEEMRR